MMHDDVEKGLARVAAAMARTQAAQQRLRQRSRVLEQRWWELDAERRRLLLHLEIGKPVRLRRRGSIPKLDDAMGTLLKINRTRALVDFAEHGEWLIPIDDLLLPGEQQGFVTRLGGAA